MWTLFSRISDNIGTKLSPNEMTLAHKDWQSQFAKVSDLHPSSPVLELRKGCGKWIETICNLMTEASVKERNYEHVKDSATFA